MQHHSPNTDERPTMFAYLAIETTPLSPDNRDDDEQPTPLAECAIETVPLPPSDALAGRTSELRGGTRR